MLEFKHIKNSKTPIHNPKIKPEAIMPPAFTLLRMNYFLFSF